MNNQDEKSLNNTNKDAITDSRDFTAKGREYTIVVMPLVYVLEYTQLPFGLVLPTEKGDYSGVYANFSKTKYRNDKDEIKDINMAEELEKWIPRLLKYKGKPATLELLYEHEWDIYDFGNFLKKAIQISG